jgi:hypothetical protein
MLYPGDRIYFSMLMAGGRELFDVSKTFLKDMKAFSAPNVVYIFESTFHTVVINVSSRIVN